MLVQAGRASTPTPSRKALNVRKLPAAPVIPSVDLHLAMNAQALSIVTQLGLGTPNRSTLQDGAGLMRTYATHVHHLQIDDQARAIAGSKIGSAPEPISTDLARQVAELLSQEGLNLTSDDVFESMRQTQESHDAAMHHIARIGASASYHAFADVLEAAASHIHEAPAAVLPAVFHPGAAHLQAQSFDATQQPHLLRVQNSCPVNPPPPPPPPSWCPGPTALGVVKGLLQGLATLTVALAGQSLQALTGLELCSAIALEAATTDAATDGLGLLMTPFEVWLCANSEAIITSIQSAYNLSTLAGKASVATQGAIAGNVMYNNLAAWLKSKGCTT